MTLECHCLQEWRQRPFPANITGEAFGLPWSPPATWLELPGLSHFLSTVGHITHGRFHLFQYLVDDKMTLEKWATGAAEQVSKPIVRDTKIIYLLLKRIWRQLDQKRVFLGLASVEWGASLKGLNYNRIGEHLKANKRGERINNVDL